MANNGLIRWPRTDNDFWRGHPASLQPTTIVDWPRGYDSSNEAETLLKEAVAWWDVDKSGFKDGDRWMKNVGSAGSLLDLRLGSSTTPNTNDPQFLKPDDQGYVYLPGVSGNCMRVTSSTSLNVSGDFDCRVLINPDTWVPSGTWRIASKDAGSATDRSWNFAILATGLVYFSWYDSAGTSIGVSSTTTPGLPLGSASWLRVTLTINNGGQYEVRFYKSSDGTNWVQIGNTVIGVGGTTGIRSSYGDIEIGSYSGGNTGLPGRYHRAIVKSGIDGITVLDVDCDAITSSSQTSFQARTGQTVTISRSTSGRKSVAMPNKTVKKIDDGHVYLPGVAGNYMSVPDEAALRITGDIDLRALIALDSWISSNTQSLIGRRVDSGNQNNYMLLVTNTGALQMYWTTNGVTTRNEISSVAVPVTNGAPLWVRTTLDVDNGAGQYEVKFYTSVDGISWSQLGTTVTGTTGVTSIQAGNVPLEIGSRNSGVNSTLAGRVYRAQVYNGINGTLVLDVDCSKAPASFEAGKGATFTAVTGQTVTLTSTANSGMLVRQEQWGAGRACMLFGTDDYMEVVDNWQHQLLNFGQGDSFTLLAVARSWHVAPSTGHTLIAKSSTLGGATPGYVMYWGGGGSLYSYVQDGTAAPLALQSNTSYGTIRSAVSVRNVVSKRLTTFINGTTGTPTTDTTAGTLATSETLRIGRISGTGTRYADIELVAAAIFRRALTAREIKILSDYYAEGLPGTKGQSQPDAVKTLESAAFWIDADRSTVTGAKIKNLGTGGSALDAMSGSTPGVDAPVYNLLTANQASVETNTTGLANYGATCSIARSTAQYVHGAASVAVTMLSNGDGGVQTLTGVNGVPVTPGKVYTASLMMKSSASRAVGAVIVWNNSSGSYISGSTSTSPTSTSTWATVRTSGVAPAGAAYATIIGYVNAGVTGEVFYFDCLGLWEGWGGDWQMPGTPITNVGADTNDPKYLVAEDAGYVYLPGTASNYLSAPDESALRITGDLDIRVRYAMDSWNPSTEHFLVTKDDVSTQRAYTFSILVGANTPYLRWSTNGSTTAVATSTASLSVSDGSAKWIRATLDVDNGASGNDVKFYTSDDGVTWTQLGSTVTSAGVTSIYAGTAPVMIGARTTATSVAGKAYRAIVKSGIDGTTVLDIDCSDITSASATSFTAKTGQTVAINRSTSGRKAVVVNRYNGGGSRWLFGTDDYMEVANRYMGLSGAGYIRVPGVSGANLSVPDADALDITGDLDLRARVSLDDWTPAAAQVLIAKGADTTYHLAVVASTGVLRLGWMSGGGYVTKDSTVAPSITDGSVLWVRATLDVDNGASGNDVKFYTSFDGSTWTQLGSTVTTAGVTSIAATTDPVTVGSKATVNTMTGNLYQAQVFNGIGGTKVLDIDTSVAVSGATTFTAVTGQTVTVNGACTQVPFPYVYLPGIINDYLSAPNETALNITGDLDIRVCAALDSWASGTTQMLVGKYAVVGTRSFYFAVTPSGLLTFIWSTDGTNGFAASSVGMGLSPGVKKWVRVVMDVDNGASGNDVKFYTSDDGSVWTQLGSTVTTAGTTSIFASTSKLEIGSYWNGSLPCTGKVYRTQIFNGIDGTKVLDVDTSVCKDDSITTFTALTGQTVTINRVEGQYKSKVITQAGYMMPWYPYNFVPSSTDLLNFGLNDSFTVVAAVREWATQGVSGIVSKKSGLSNEQGYALYTNTTNGFYVADGAAGAAVTATPTPGAFITLVGKRDVFTDKVTQQINDGVPVALTDPTTTSSFTAVPLRIGTLVATSGYAAVELYSVAVFRRALSTAEIKSIDDWYRKRGLTTFVQDSDTVRKAYLSSKLGTSDDAVLSILKDAVFHVDAKAYTSGSQYVENLGWRKDALNARLGSGQSSDTNDPQWLTPDTKGYVYLPRVAGNSMQVPHEAAFVTTDFDWRASLAMDSWTPSIDQTVIGKWANSSSGPGLAVLTTGRLRLDWVESGVTYRSVSSTASTGFANGAASWIRGVLDVDNGAGQYSVKFYTSNDGTTWTQLGTTVTGTTGVTNVGNSTASPLYIGTIGPTNNPLAARVYRAQVLNGIDGTTVLDIDCDAITSGSATSFTATTGQTVTINRSTSGRKSVAVPSTSKGGRSCFLFGTDDYMEVEGDVQHDLLNFLQSEDFTVFVSARRWATSAFGAVLSKKSSTAQTTTGYYQYYDTSNSSGMRMSDGVLGPFGTAQTISTDVMHSFGFVRDASGRKLKAFLDGSFAADASDTTTAALSGTDPLQIGRLGTGSYADMELRAALVFRRALTAQEITTLSNYYSGG